MSDSTLFGTDGIRAIANKPPLVPEQIKEIGSVLGWMGVEFPGAFAYPHGQEVPESLNSERFESGKPSMVIVRDPRQSGHMIESALVSGLTAAGADVFLCGMLPTPAASFLTRHLQANLGISISASHNPPEYNGIKLFSPGGEKISSFLEEKIESMVHDEHDYPPVPVQDERIGTVERIPDRASEAYTGFLLEHVEDAALDSFHVIVDAAHGAGASIANTLFERLDCKTTILSGEPDGDRINQKSGTANIDGLCEAVLDQEADLGIAMDGDADRALLVDEQGTVQNGDAILAALAVSMKEEGTLNENTVVGTVMSNQGFERYLNQNEITLKRTQVGDRNIAKELHDNNWSLGGEQSGHIILFDRSPTGDALQTGLTVLRWLAKKETSASSFLSRFETHPQVLENVTVSEKPPLDEQREINKRTAYWEDKLQDEGRVLIRYSGTEPVCRVMVEGIDQALIEEAAGDLADVIQNTLPTST